MGFGFCGGFGGSGVLDACYGSGLDCGAGGGFNYGFGGGIGGGSGCNHSWGDGAGWGAGFGAGDEQDDAIVYDEVRP